MSGESKVKAILFDVGGVLQVGFETPHEKGIQETLAKKFKLSVDDYLDAIDTYYTRSTEGLISEKELLQILSKNLNVTEKKLKKIFYSVYYKKLKLNRGALRIAKKLKKAGYKVGILSDQWHLSKEATVPPYFYKIFKPIVISCDVGMRKPNPKIYKLALKKLKLQPGEVVFIDNRIWNLPAANKLGIKTVLFSKNKLLKKQLREFGINL